MRTGSTLSKIDQKLRLFQSLPDDGLGRILNQLERLLVVFQNAKLSREVRCPAMCYLATVIVHCPPDRLLRCISEWTVINGPQPAMAEQGQLLLNLLRNRVVWVTTIWCMREK